jgi:hypothetical protein
VDLNLLADGVENPANLERIGDVARLLGGSCVATAAGRLIAVENTPGAKDVFGRRPPRDDVTLAVGNERRGISRATLQAAHETVLIPSHSRTVNTLNVAAAAAVAGWYVKHGSGAQAQSVQPDKRRPAVLLCGDDHVEVGSSLRSAAAFGWRELFLEDRGSGWFDGEHAHRREARAAARRHKNPLRIRRGSPEIAGRFEETVVVVPAGDGQPLKREHLARGRTQLVVIGADVERVAAATDGTRLRVATLGLAPMSPTPLRVTASIALAEIARQVGRPKGRPSPPRPREPVYERELELKADPDAVEITTETLLAY